MLILNTIQYVNLQTKLMIWKVIPCQCQLDKSTPFCTYFSNKTKCTNIWKIAGNALARVQRAQTRRSLGHHLLHPLILRLLVLCAPADFETQSSPGCTCTRRSKFLTHCLSLPVPLKNYRRPKWMDPSASQEYLLRLIYKNSKCQELTLQIVFSEPAQWN